MAMVQTQGSQRLVVWLCAVIIGLHSSVLARGGVVQCTGADGEARLEWLCAKDSAGHCEQVCAPTGDDDHSDPLPCDDRPLQGHVTTIDRSPAKSGIALIAMPACIGFVGDLQPATPPGAVATYRAAACRAPPSLAGLRTVIILV